MNLRVLRTALVALASVAVTASSAVIPARAQVEVSVDLFYNELAPHGRWIHHPRWGWVWFPRGVEGDWRPYTRGHWVWTEEYGWYWAAEEPFGWAVYHYGRWGYDPEYGWIWVPGRVWGPAWVAFRYSDQAVGWAPLPPDTLAYSSFGAAPYTILNAGYYQPRWIFVPTRYFMSPRVYGYAVPPSRNHLFIRQTVNVTNYVTVNNVIVNRSIAPRRIERVTGERVLAMRANTVNDAGQAYRGGPAPNVVNVYRPVIRATPGAAPPPAALAKPDEKPRLAVHRNLVPPNERRAAPMTTTPHAALTPTEPGKPSQPGGPRTTPPTGPGTPGLRTAPDGTATPGGPAEPKKAPGPTTKIPPGGPPSGTLTPGGQPAPKKGPGTPTAKRAPDGPPPPDVGTPPAGPSGPQFRRAPGGPTVTTPPSGSPEPKILPGTPTVRTTPGVPPGTPGGPPAPVARPPAPPPAAKVQPPPTPIAKPPAPPPPAAKVQPPPAPPAAGKKEPPPCGKPGQPPCPPQ